MKTYEVLITRYFSYTASAENETDAIDQAKSYLENYPYDYDEEGISCELLEEDNDE